MIEPLEWPQETNTQMRDELLREKLNEVIRSMHNPTDPVIAVSSNECLHPADRVYKMGHVMKCKDCKKVWKP